jgi:hypothetical protein
VTIQYLLGDWIRTDFNRATVYGRLLLFTARNREKVNRNRGQITIA